MAPAWTVDHPRVIRGTTAERQGRVHAQCGRMSSPEWNYRMVMRRRRPLDTGTVRQIRITNIYNSYRILVFPEFFSGLFSRLDSAAVWGDRGDTRGPNICPQRVIRGGAGAAQRIDIAVDGVRPGSAVIRTAPQQEGGAAALLRVGYPGEGALARDLVDGVEVRGRLDGDPDGREAGDDVLRVVKQSGGGV